jgi:hypothetical protein
LAAKLDRYASRQPVGGHRAVLIQLAQVGREHNLHRWLTGSVFSFTVATTVSVSGLLEVNWRRVGEASRASLAALGAGAVIS